MVGSLCVTVDLDSRCVLVVAVNAVPRHSSMVGRHRFPQENLVDELCRKPQLNAVLAPNDRCDAKRLKMLVAKSWLPLAWNTACS